MHITAHRVHYRRNTATFFDLDYSEGKRTVYSDSSRCYTISISDLSTLTLAEKDS